MLSISVDGHPRIVREGTTVAAALLSAGAPSRISITGEPRTALCGMGICYECRATVDGIAHRRTCLLTCAEGMEIETGAQAATFIEVQTR
jgi:predicted molibdopterin-dependent oxidoreductase YjgC